MTGVAIKAAVASLAVGLGLVGVAQTPPAGAVKPGTSRLSSKTMKPSAEQVQPVIPPPVYPKRPYEQPPVPPLVTYQNGQLSIMAQNATLSAILSAVRARTGAHMEIPPAAGNERVAVQLGPGNPREVMASLLEGSKFDFIVLGSAEDPDALSQVILTSHEAAGTGMTASAGQTPPPSIGQQPREPGPPGPFRGGAARPEMNAEEEEAEPPPEPITPGPAAENPEAQPGTIYQPNAPIPNVPPIEPQGQPDAQNPGQVKTPEQLLQELQRMQQQQQQQRPQK
jgi:hypothetical protein